MAQESATDRRPEGPDRGDWRPIGERAPSVTLAEEPQIARWVGVGGLTVIAMGVITFYMYAAYSRVGIIPLPLAGFFVAAGIGCLLYHAASDKDVQVRRIYGGAGAFLVAASILISVVPFPQRPAGALFLPYGLVGLTLGLLFLLPFVRNEEDVNLRGNAIRALGAVGAGMALVGLIGGNVSVNFLLDYGLPLAALGLLYLWAFVTLQGLSTELGYRAALAIGIAGAVVFVVALGRSVLPALFYKWGWIKPPPPAPFFVPSGLLLMLVGLVYGGLAAGLYSDRPIIVLARRELAAYFYSPIAYLVLLGFTVIAFLSYWNFIGMLLPDPERMLAPRETLEPIIRPYFFSLYPVVALFLIVPVLTMRALSEEQRTGTMEVLMTAPVTEVSVVLSKFFAALVFFLFLWLPWGGFLLALRVGSGQPFDYRPLLSFLLALTCTGGSFLAMGLFFSSLTRNQIVAAVLTFAGMLGHLSTYILQGYVARDGVWAKILPHVSFLDLWLTTLEGKLPPQDLLIFISQTVFWLYLTLKVLQSRTWR
jgi:hypothetical protein